MKIYLFCQESGIYQGEDFADEPSMKHLRAALPPGATTIAPPPYGPAQTPIFLAAENRWEVRSLPLKPGPGIA